MIKQYRKKPVVIDAVKYHGSSAEERLIIEWLRGSSTPAEVIDGVLIIKTLEGNMTVSVGDFVIRGIKGEAYPCKPDIFLALYDGI